MKTNLKREQNSILKLACKGLRYFLLTLFGFAIVIVLSQVFGAVPIVRILLSPSLWIWFLRIAVFLFCLFAIAMIFESWS